MRIIAKAVFGFVVFLALIIAAVFMFTGGMVKDTKAFFSAIKSGDTTKASGYLSQSFLDSTSIEEFKAYFDSSELAGYKDSSWSNRSVANNLATISGNIETESGEKIPLSVKLIKENNRWKILAIDFQAAGLNSANVLPPESEQLKLLMDSMSAFADSVDNKSMELFRNHVSALWRNQDDIERFEKDFSSVYGNDFRSAIALSPIFDQEAVLDENGVMTIKGYYPLEGRKLKFEQSYIREGLQWKLVSFQFQVEKN